MTVIGEISKLKKMPEIRKVKIEGGTICCPHSTKLTWQTDVSTTIGSQRGLFVLRDAELVRRNHGSIDVLEPRPNNLDEVLVHMRGCRGDSECQVADLIVLSVDLIYHPASVLRSHPKD